MSVNCPNCGITNEDGARFCMNCGASLAQTKEPVVREANVTPTTENYGDPYRQEPVQSYGAYQQEPVYPVQEPPQYQQSQYQQPQQYQQQAQYSQPQYQPQYAQPQYPQPYPAASAKKKKHTGVAIVISLIALLLVAGVVLVVVLPLTAHVDVFGLHLFDNDPKGVTERMLKAAYVDFNAKDVANCLYESKYATEGFKDSDIAQLQTILDTLKSQMKSANASVKYNILDEYYVEDAKYNETIEKMKKDGTDTAKIEKMIDVDFTLEANGNKSDTMTALCIKADGKWYVSGYTFTDTMSSM